MEEKLKGKEAVKTTIDADGNIELSYASNSVRGLMIGKLLAIPVGLVSVLAGGEMAKVGGLDGDSELAVGMLFGIFCACLFVAFFSHRKEKITIVKDKGIKFLKQELPFSSIDTLKVVDRQAGEATFSFVVAQVRGRNIDITRGVSRPLSEKIFREVISNSPNLARSR